MKITKGKEMRGGGGGDLFPTVSPRGLRFRDREKIATCHERGWEMRRVIDCN